MSLLEDYGLQKDPRFKQARREAMWIVWLIVAQTVWVFGLAYLGLSRSGADIPRILGIPAWYCWAFIGVAGVAPVVAVLIALKIKDCDLE